MNRTKPSFMLQITIIVLLTFLIFPARHVSADEIQELKRQIEILAQKITLLEQKEEHKKQLSKKKPDMNNTVTAGDFPGSIKLPGTDTSLKIGGYVQTTYIYDIGPRPTSRGGDIASPNRAILENDPGYEIRGDTRISARNSRFNITSLTPTRLGSMKTFIEADFNGPPNNKGSRATTNRTALGVRHAYGQLGNVLFGQYWSNFSDNSVFASTVDGTGPAGRNFMRQGQIRYIHEFDNGARFAVALENPRGDFIDADDNNLDDKFPDLTSHYRYQTDRWHLQFAGMLRRIGINEGTIIGANSHTNAWGLNQSGAFLLPDSKDRISWYFAFGNGIGRYLEGGANQGASITADGTLDTQFGYGGFVTYQHWWTDTLQSNVDFGFSWFDLNLEENPTANHRLLSSHINLMWLPLENLEFGIEYVWGHRKVLDGREGSINRINALSVFYF